MGHDTQAQLAVDNDGITHVAKGSEVLLDTSRVTTTTNYGSQAHTSSHDISSAQSDHYTDKNELPLDSLNLLPRLYQKRHESVKENMKKEPLSPKKLEPHEYLELKRKLLPLLLGRESNSDSSSESSQEAKSHSKHKKKKSKHKKKKKSSK